MRPVLVMMTVVLAFGFGMSASMAQQPRQMDPGTIKVTPPSQPAPVVTPSATPNLNTSKNPYETKRYMETPVQQPGKR